MRSELTRLTVLLLLCCASAAWPLDKLRYHNLQIDNQGKIVPWFSPAEKAFDNYLDRCWDWALSAPPDSNGLPISFLYCAWKPGEPPSASPEWENDAGEKIPNWVESARLYYQYSGNRAPLDYVKRLVDYSLEHGQTPSDHAWPDFPVGTSNAGDTGFRGFTGRWKLWDCHVDLAADIGFALYRMHQLYGERRYLEKAVHVADLLAARIRPGTAEESPWPYVVNSLTGKSSSRYAASWDGALMLFDLLVRNGQGRVADYERARVMLKEWLLAYPMRNGRWVDGHSDTWIDGNTNLSTTCASDMCLYLFDNPGWDPAFKADAEALIRWTEDNFVLQPTPDSLPGQFHGAYVPAEQTAYNYRMGYQAARLGAQYAQWYKVSGDEKYRDRAYRCLVYNTYMMQENGQSSDGPTDEVGWWWSDCYGEAPRMYYYGLAAVPEWAPPDENHLLHSSSIVTTVIYSNRKIEYSTLDSSATELFRLCQKPESIKAGGIVLNRLDSLTQSGWTFDSTAGVLRVRHDKARRIEISLNQMEKSIRIDGAAKKQLIDGFGVNVNHRSWNEGGLLPVLEAMIDQAGMTIFRIVFDNADWEAENDNDNPAVMDAGYYGAIFSSQRFQPLWDMFAWFNRRGLSDNVFLNFMGPGPEWMGGGNLTAGMEREWAETITALLLYAREKRGLKFHLAAPDNEPDIRNEGIHMEAEQYARSLHELSLRLDASGLGDLRFVAPDRAGGGTGYLPELLNDPVIMGKLAHFGMHSYSDNGGGSKGVESFVRGSAYPDRRFWMTEFNVWLPNADNGQRGTYDWPYCRGTAKYLLDHLANGASAGLIWEGYDSFYLHPPSAWSFWGLFSVDDENVSPRTYTPRKNFYTLAQISRFVRPGAQRIEVDGSPALLKPLLAFYHSGQKRLALVGINSTAGEVVLHGSLEALPGVTALDLYYTTSTANLVQSGRMTVKDGKFTATIPADCVFTLASPPE